MKEGRDREARDENGRWKVQLGRREREAKREVRDGLVKGVCERMGEDETRRRANIHT